ncbi:RagB/SusD family nutrient uptake outer membrane protein [Niabella hirudinis]|uniref:RagB/SusD family nutrient uptake outer membrane protein n=1 Tax=Niabella hirudinis TaxID=1285929 RepID=UPI003EBB4BB6
MKKNIFKKWLISLPVAVMLFIIIIIGCTRVLDKRDLSAIPQELLYTDASIATANLNNLYVAIMPTWSADVLNISNQTDEAGGATATMYGQLTTNSVDYWTTPYTNIRNVNNLLQILRDATYSDADKNLIKGQLHFLRAWQYFQLVTRYGGVPLLLSPQPRVSAQELEVPRNKTSECIQQILKDLDTASVLCPKSWSATDAGRITAGAVLAFKGRVLLHYASEQFDPAQTAANRWQDAFTANKQAKDSLIAAGKSLMPEFGNLWFTEGDNNKEAVLVTRFSNPGRTQNRDACVRPLDEALNCTGGDQPSLSIARAFPMKNGLPITDPASGYNPDAYWLNRDPRFEATIAYNGDPWALSNKSSRIQWTFQGSQQTGGTGTGFYSKKAINTALSPLESTTSGTDWIEIRFAEVLMNYAEASNEVGNTDEAYAVLKQIRQRAGITAGADNMYGLKANMSRAEMRAAILFERRIEFAFEGKRMQDLRRRRLYGAAMNGTRRQGITVTLKAPLTKAQFEAAYAAGTVNLNTSYNTYFTDAVVDLDQLNTINYKPEYYFYAIPTTHLEKNKKLQQTSGWDAGSFDPLQ